MASDSSSDFSPVWAPYTVEYQMNHVNYTEVCTGNTAIEPWVPAHNVITGIKS